MADRIQTDGSLGHWDVVVVGGGPAGASAASLLAQRGHRVLLLEKERFPRYHIGESLIPGCLRVLDALGVREAVESAGFVVKRGVTFAWGIDRDWSISFDEQGAEPNYAFQVERSRFDQILLDHARAAGAVVRESAPVRNVDADSNGARITCDEGTFTADYVIDASGQASVLGRERGERYFDESLRNVALWRYFRGAARLPSPRQGNIAVVRHGDEWWWYIPLEPDAGGLTSVGMVLSTEAYRQRRGDADTIFEEARAATPELIQWLAAAHPVSETRVTADWSFRSRHVVGERWLLAGDAAGFIDPLLSTGCYLALTGGYLAGLCVGSALREPGIRAAAFRYYSNSYERVVDEIHRMVRVFYQTIRPQEAFDGAQRILGDSGDPRELFIRLAAGLTEQSPGHEGSHYFEESGLPSEVFGSHRVVPKRYGVPFSVDAPRILGPVDPADLPVEVAGEIMLVEQGRELRLIPAADLASGADSVAEAPSPGNRPALTLAEVTNDALATQLLLERMPPGQAGDAALLVYGSEGAPAPVVVGFVAVESGKRYWTQHGTVGLLYLTDPDFDPYADAGCRALLEEIRRVAASVADTAGAAPRSLQQAVAAALVRTGWRLIGRAPIELIG